MARSDAHAVDERNSTSTTLGSSGVFTGAFRDVSTFVSVSVTIQSDVASKFSGIRLEWSTDGVSNDVAPQLFSFDPLVVSQDGFTVHATVRAQYVRVVYENGTSAQSVFTLTTLLRRGAMSGTVRSLDPLNTFTTNIDVQEVQSIMSGVGLLNPEQVQIAKMDDVNLLPSNLESYLFVSPRPALASNTTHTQVAATLSAVQLTPSLLTRKVFLSITNRVLRGNLYIKLGTSSGLTTTSYDYKILPGHTWQDPGAFGSVFAGHVFGRWDEIYVHSVPIQAGVAEVVINRYGP